MLFILLSTDTLLSFYHSQRIKGKYKDSEAKPLPRKKSTNSIEVLKHISSSLYYKAEGFLCQKTAQVKLCSSQRRGRCDFQLGKSHGKILWKRWHLEQELQKYIGHGIWVWS